MSTPKKKDIQLWDWPTRMFHWLLVAAVSIAIASGLVGGSWMDVHGKAGLTICGLLVFRLIWGFVGNHYARFSSFVPSPRRLLAYLRGSWQGLGHNPLGALSVLALLGLLSLQVGTGLVSNDEIAFTGPLAGLVSESLSLRLTGLHHLLAKLLFVLLGLHVLAIYFHTLVKKDNLVKPMLSGRKQVDSNHPEVPPHKSAWQRLLLGLTLATGAVYLASGAALGKEPASVAPAKQSTAPKPAW
jgi:cytochrome b